MSTTDPCTQIKFDCTDFNAGYVPFGEGVDLAGLVTFSTLSDIAGSTSITFTSACNELAFPDGEGGYQSTYTLIVNPDTTYYIPIQITSTSCGAGECGITMSYSKEGIPVSCPDTELPTIKWYNATCDFQRCILSASNPVFCKPLVECGSDFCKDEPLQYLTKMIMLDQAIQAKITEKDWGVVNKIYSTAFEMCKCRPNQGSPCGDSSQEAGCADCGGSES